MRKMMIAAVGLAMLIVVVLGAAVGLPGVSGQAPGLEPRVEDLSAMTPNSDATWQAGYRTTGAQVAAMLPGLDVLWRWDGRRWQPYATRADGELLPGAANFTIETGDRLWIGSFDPSRMPQPEPEGAVISEGHRRGLVADRAVVGDPDAPVLIVDYGDFL